MNSQREELLRTIRLCELALAAPNGPERMYDDAFQKLVEAKAALAKLDVEGWDW